MFALWLDHVLGNGMGHGEIVFRPHSKKFALENVPYSMGVYGSLEVTMYISYCSQISIKVGMIMLGCR